MESKEISKLVQGLRTTSDENNSKSNQVTLNKQNSYSSISSSFEIVRSNKSINNNGFLSSSGTGKINDDEKSKTLTEENYSVCDDNNYSSSKNINVEYIMRLRGMENRYGGLNAIDQRTSQVDPRNLKQENKQEIKFNTGRWSNEEHQKFIEAMFLYGNEWKRVQQHIRSRSSTQARSHAQKFFIRLRKKFIEDSDGDNKSASARRNEKIFNWIKESVNYDTIARLAKNSGNLLSTEESAINQPNINSSAKSKTCNKPTNFQSQESFFAERKDKMCKIIMNLISNPSKTKRKNFSKEDFSEFDMPIEEDNISVKTLNNDSNRNEVFKSSAPNIHANIMTNSNNFNNNSQNKLNTNKIPVSNNIPYIHFPEIEDYNCSDYFPFTNNVFNNQNMNENINNNPYLFNNEDNLESVLKQSKISSSEAYTPYAETNPSPLSNLKITNKPAPSSNNYFNPNLNSFISIVTINLGCNNTITKTEDFNNNNSNKENNVYKNYVNTTTNSNDNINLVVNNFSDTRNNNSNDFKDLLSRKLLMMEYQKLIKKNVNIGNSTVNNTITNTSHLNIINGVAKINEKDEKEKETPLDNDPFKLTFEENNQQSPRRDENDYVNLNLDLDHFFNTDNFLN